MRELSVFISSPGDVAEERIIAGRVLERVGLRFANRARLRVCFWEHLPLKASAHFQPQIPKPSRFDVVVMMLWSRIGTRLPEELRRPDGSHYESGTEFEFEDALAGFRERGFPHLLVYRKKASVMVELTSDEDRMLEVSRQKRSVDRFIDRWFQGADGSLKAAFHQFQSTSEFEDQLDHHLRALFEEMLGGGHFTESAVEWDRHQRGSPFRGLQRFELEHRTVYFGRTKAINEVLETLRQHAAAGCPFVLVFGKSGTGKSSFLRAGVLPFLIEPGVMEGVGAWRYAIFEPSDSTGDLVDGLAAALLTSSALPGLGAALGTREATDSEREQELASLLRKSPEAAVPLLRAQLNALADVRQQERPLEAALEARLAVLIDPVEEIFTRTGATPEDRECFLCAIGALARSGLVWVLGSMRSDFYERCAEHPALLDLKSGHGQYHLAPATAAEMARMVRLPAQLAGLEFEEHAEDGSLDEVLLEAASGDPGALPLLQFTLDEIYQRGDAATTGRLTFATYHALGGLHGAVRTRAEETLASVERELGLSVEATFSAVFSALVGFKDEAAQSSVRLYSPLERLTADPDRKKLVEAFIEARLFITDIDDEHRPVVTLSHETLLRHWPRLATWIEHNQDFLRARNRLAADAARWRDEGHDAAFLRHEGKPLAEGRELLAQHRAKLSPSEIEFLDASIAQAEQRRRLARRRTRIVVTCMAGLAILAAIMAVISVGKARDAAAKAQEAEEQAEIASYRRIVALNALNATSRARDKSERRADKSEQLAETLFKDVFSRLQPSDVHNRQMIETIAGATRKQYEDLQIDPTESDERRAVHVNNILAVGENLAKMGRYFEALTFGAGLAAQLPSLPKLQPRIVWQVHKLVAVCHNQLGEYDEAETCFKQALETAATPEQIEESRGRLGELYRHLGRYVESERLLRLADLKVANPTQLASLGELHRYQGRLEHADRVLSEARDRTEREYAALKAKRDALDAQREGAVTADEIRRHDRALGEMEGKLLKAASARSEAMSNLGVLRFDQGRMDEAETLVRAALVESQRIDGAEHPNVASSQYKLARILLARGPAGFKEAEQLLLSSRRTLIVVFGDANQRTAKCLEVLADLRAGQGQYDAAEQLVEQVLKIRRNLFKPPHPEIAKSLQQFGRILEKKGETERALAVHAEAEEMQENHGRREAMLAQEAQ
jgi:tetratricopeptide (TPR) repeat protein